MPITRRIHRGSLGAISLRAESRDVSEIVAQVHQLVRLMRQLRADDRPISEHDILVTRIRLLLQEIDSAVADLSHTPFDALGQTADPAPIPRLSPTSELTLVQADDFQGLEDFSVIEDLKAFGNQHDIEKGGARPDIPCTPAGDQVTSQFDAKAWDELMATPTPAVNATVYHDPTAIRRERNRAIVSIAVVVAIGAAIAANFALLAGLNGLEIAATGILGSAAAVLVWKALGGVYPDL